MQENITVGGPAFDLIVLDLNMPISDGYDAIKNIKNLYTDKKLFKIDRGHLFYEMKVPSQSPAVSQKFSLEGSTKNELKKQGSRFGSIVPPTQELIQSVQPVIIALTAMVNDHVLEMTKHAGFDATYEVPIQTQVIKEEVLPLISKNHMSLHMKQMLLQQFSKPPPATAVGVSISQQGDSMNPLKKPFKSFFNQRTVVLSSEIETIKVSSETKPQ